MIRSLSQVSRHDDLDAVGSLVEQGLIRPLVQRTFEMQDIIAALRASMATGTVGKLSLTP